MENKEPGDQDDSPQKIDVPKYKIAPPLPQENGFLILLKIVGVLILGVFVLGGLIFATCFFSIRR
jgi:hypothetical protein